MDCAPENGVIRVLRYFFSVEIVRVDADNFLRPVTTFLAVSVIGEKYAAKR